MGKPLLELLHPQLEALQPLALRGPLLAAGQQQGSGQGKGAPAHGPATAEDEALAALTGIDQP
jgi:hypothetical protein